MRKRLGAFTVYVILSGSTLVVSALIISLVLPLRSRAIQRGERRPVQSQQEVARE